MSVFEKHRFKIFNQGQHPYKHEVGDFAYTNATLPLALTVGDALDYLIAAMYPNFKGEVATPAALPGTGTLNDYYIVTDDGDGKRAGYVWSYIDGVEQWIKRFDVDWSTEGLLAHTNESIKHVYVHKWGQRDLDENAVAFAGDLAGQRIYGSTAANEHLILYANSGDAVGNTGYVQFGDDTRPLVDSTFSSGSSTYRWLNVFSDNLHSGTLSTASGSITDSSGAISFGDENLSTSGTLGCGVLTASTGSTVGDLTLANGSITDSSGAISFGDENLSTTGTFQSSSATFDTTLNLSSGSITDTSGAISFGDENLTTTGTLSSGNFDATQATIDDVVINSNGISIGAVDTNLVLSANGTGVVDINSGVDALDITATGTVGVTGILNADNLRIDGNTLSATNANGSVIIEPDGIGSVQIGSTAYPVGNSTFDLGKTGNVWNDFWVDGSIQDDNTAFAISDLMSLRNVKYRDSGQVSAVQNGDCLFYDDTSGTWLASAPDSEINHGDLSGLTTSDAGHTQFVLLAGRAGGQSVQGGTAASENLDLESTSNATKGDIRVKDDLIPFTTASYTTFWAGTDLGDVTHVYRDLYTAGEAKGLRVQNFTFAALPATASSNKGRLTFATDQNKVYVDTGSAHVQVGNVNKYVSDLSYNGTDLVKNIDVSSSIDDARNAQKQLFDNTNDFELLNVEIKATSASNIRITTNIALPAGSYRLIVLE